jgi:pentatricopeptide repeat protein
LNQTYAHVIRTHVLDVYTAPFHWNNLIRCYTRLGAPNKALQIYVSMSHAGITPDYYTLPIVLKAPCQITGYWVHACMVERFEREDIILIRWGMFME